MMSVRPYDEIYKDDLISLIGHPSYKAEIWDWQFSFNGQNQCLLATQDDEVIGFNGVMPINVWYRGETHRSAWSCDFYVAKDHRGQGVGKVIKDELLKLPSRFIMSLGISDSAFKLLLAKGWLSIPSVRVYRKRMHMNRFRELIYILFQYANVLKSRRYDARDCAYRVLKNLPEPNQLDRLWNQSKQGYDACVVRDSQYLTWRYSKHPLADYQYSCAFSGDELVGILVFKVEKDNFRVVDYIGPAQAAGLKIGLLKNAISLYPSKLNSLTFTTSDDEWGRVLLSMGFYSSRNTERFVVHDKAPSKEVVHWFITAGDSDGEVIQSAVYSLNKRTGNEHG